MTQPRPRRRSDEDLAMLREAAVALFERQRPVAAVARILGLHRKVAHDWHRAFKTGGQAAVTGRRAGRRRSYAQSALDALRAEIDEHLGPRSYLYLDVDRLMERHLGNKFTYRWQREILRRIGFERDAAWSPVRRAGVR